MTKDNHKAADKRVRRMYDFIPGEVRLAHKLQEFLKSVVDKGTSIDSGYGDLSGTGNPCADLHPVIGGVEYHIAIRSTRKV
jgi:hypothetical protein